MKKTQHEEKEERVLEGWEGRVLQDEKRMC